jgi:hypothetical protein
VFFGIFGAAGTPTATDATLRAGEEGLLFREFVASVPPVTIKPTVTKIHEAERREPWTMGPKPAWRSQEIPMAPEEKEFAKAAAWTIDLPAFAWSPTLSDVFLRVKYQGDVARLYREGALVDDNFWNGIPWEVGMREVATAKDLAKGAEFQLRILPLPENAPMFLEARDRLHFENGAADALESVEMVPQYRLVVTPPAAR